MIDMEERDLPITFLQNHDQSVGELPNLQTSDVLQMAFRRSAPFVIVLSGMGSLRLWKYFKVKRKFPAN